jgi:predicted metal-dependent hydrolase
MTTPHSYKLVRSKRRTIALIVTPDSFLTVRAPIRAPVSLIEQFINEKREWIQNTMARVAARPQEPLKKFVSGDQFLYLGHSYPLIVTDTAKSLSFRDEFILSQSKQFMARRLFLSWYRKEAKINIPIRVHEWANRFELKFKSIKITSANHRWGSCSSKGNLNFTWRLIMTPLWVIDYVIVHELAHLEHKNHSSLFWECVKKMYPHYKEADLWLRENQEKIKL